MKHFVKPAESYGRKYDIVSTYIQDMGTYLHLLTKDDPNAKSLEDAQRFTADSIKEGGRRELQIPDVMVLIRNKFGDRERHVVRFDRLLADIFSKREILSPSLTAYVHPDIKVSLLAEFIQGNLKKRSTAKHEMFVADMKGDKVLAAIKNATQTTMKIKNNALSGAQCSPYTVLWNKSAHSTLTSTCRTATSYGNANNEKFLLGNRHYWSPDIVKGNIISIINHSDYTAIEAAMQRHGLQHPSVEQTMDCITRSTEAYWRHDEHMARIEALVKALSPIQRSAFVFTSDLYHLAQVNPEFTRQFFTEMSVKPTRPMPMEEAIGWVGKMDDNLKAFISMICAAELRGGTMKEAKEREEDYGIIGATVKQVIDTLDRYEDLIQAFWVTNNLPSSVFYLPSIMRRSAIVSDTDSTIFTVQYWTEWYVGRLDFSETSIAVANTAVYLAGQLIRHILSTFSANMGVAKKELTRLEMKNEYYFPVFAVTARAKHYFAYVSAQEGNVFKQMKTEIKGVGLRNSNVPPALTKASHALMRKLMDTIMEGKKISLKQVLRYVAQKEESIRQSILRGETTYLKSVNIKEYSSYKDPTKTNNYDHYVLWEAAFAQKYGHAPNPPYRAVKLPMDTDSPVLFRRWMDGIEDKNVATAIVETLALKGRKNISQFLVPEAALSSAGIPKELAPAVDIRGTITQVMEGFYIVLECLGYYMRNDFNTRLISDERWLLDDNWPHGELEMEV